MSQKNNNSQQNGYQSLSPCIEESFSQDYGDAYGKELYFNDNNLNDTILDQKMRNIAKNESNQKANDPNDSFALINDFEIYDFTDDKLNISLREKNKSDYLSVRKIPNYPEKEYIDIKKNVSNGLLEIQNYLINLRIDYTKFDPKKKVGPLMPLNYIIENNYKFLKERTKDMQEKYDRLKNYIYNLRTIYGDGNCYYRSVIFRYIELLILNKKADIIKLLIVDIYKSFQSSEIKQRLNIENEYLRPQLILQIMITILELVQSNRIAEAHLAFYKALLYCKIFDYSLILYLRYIYLTVF